MVYASSFFKGMNREQIEELLIKITEIIEYLDDGREKEAYRETALSAESIRRFLLLLLECNILEEKVAVGLMTDIVDAVEQKDVVLMTDSLRYGVRTLLQDVLKIMGESNE